MTFIRRGGFRQALFLLLTASFACTFGVPAQAADVPKRTAPVRIASAAPAAAPAEVVESSEATAVFTKAAPESVDDLLAIEKKVVALSKKILPATVGVRIGRAQGSGVIISEDGYVLTAAHVAGAPGRDVEFIMHDGRKLRGTTLGLHRGLDAGLMKIATKGKWDFVPMGKMKDIHVGDWCLATGHPGGYHTGRAPVVRLGRIVLKRDSVIQTDCALVGGDSGGPLFDMEGRVIGIHSRIGPSIAWNFHVPIAAYHDGWEKMVNSEVWGGRPARGSAVMGVNGDDHPEGAKVTGLPEGFPAHEAGIQVGDIITKIDGETVKGFDQLAQLVLEHEPGDEVEVEILRDGERMVKKVTLAARE